MKYFVSAFAIVFIALVAVILIVVHPGKKSTPNTSTSTSKTSKAVAVKLLDYENKDASVSVTVQGKLVGEDQRRAVRITISPEDRGIDLLNGYTDTVERSQHYRNTQSGYATFIRALNYAGFMTKKASATSDERGVCPGGNTYIYELFDESGKSVSRLWGASCNVALGPFGGAGPAVRQLFQAQITDYDKFIEGVKL